MMLRAVFPAAALVAALFSVVIGRVAPSANASVCLYGGCRYDQIYSSIEAAGATPATLAALVQEDSSNPLAWADYADYMARRGDAAQAERLYARALDLGPGLAPVLMRVANFDFTHGRNAHGLTLVPRILDLTSEYDEVLFSYLKMSGTSVTDALNGAIPASPLPARSWINWLRTRANADDLASTWAWMQHHHLADLKAATDTVNALWQQHAYDQAQRVWIDWLGARAGDYPRSQLLTNTRFDTEPIATPFDWDISSRRGVQYARRDGLEVRFLATENLADAGVRQYAIAPHGTYRLTMEVSAEGVSTDEGVFFEVSDAENASRLRVRSAALAGNVTRSTRTTDIVVPAGTRILQIQLARKPSLKFDNQLAGLVRVHRVALTSVD
jgi:tetratricopeptide (TPR) repeat protein